MKKSQQRILELLSERSCTLDELIEITGYKLQFYKERNFDMELILVGILAIAILAYEWKGMTA